MITSLKNIHFRDKNFLYAKNCMDTQMDLKITRGEESKGKFEVLLKNVERHPISYCLYFCENDPFPHGMQQSDNIPEYAADMKGSSKSDAYHGFHSLQIFPKCISLSKLSGYIGKGDEDLVEMEISSSSIDCHTCFYLLILYHSGMELGYSRLVLGEKVDRIRRLENCTIKFSRTCLYLFVFAMLLIWAMVLRVQQVIKVEMTDSGNLSVTECKAVGKFDRPAHVEPQLLELI